MADPADTADADVPEGSARDTESKLKFRNADVFAAAAASRREEFVREAAEIGGSTLPDDDPHPDQHPDAGAPDGRDTESAADPAGTDDGAAPAASSAGAADAPTDDELVEVKVNGQVEKVAKADVDAAGGVAAYQKAKAADRRLADAAERQRQVEESEARLRARAKALGIDYDTGQPIQGNTPRAGGDAGSNPAPTQTADAPTNDELEAALEEASQQITLLDPGQVKESLRKVVQAAGKAVQVDRDAVARVVAEREQINRSKAEWNDGWKGHEDVLGDEDAAQFARALMRKEMIEDLVRGGAQREACANLSDQQLGGYHLVARQHGVGRPLPDIMSTAISTTRQRLGITKPAASTGESGAADGGKPIGQGRGTAATPKPTAAAIAKRQEIKGGSAVATSTPASSASAQARPKLSMGNSPSEYVANMRKARGQPPNGPVP